MTERYGRLFASFWEWNDATYTVVNYGGSTALSAILSAEVTRKKSTMTRARFTLAAGDNWEQFVVEGRLCSLYQYDRVLNGDRHMGTFQVQKVREKHQLNGQHVIEVSGLGAEHLLTKYRHWTPIGAETIYATTLTTAAIAPWATTVAVGAPHGNDSVSLANNANFEVGDEIRIAMDNGDTFVGTITGVDPPGAPSPETVQFSPRIPYDAGVGKAVSGRKGRLVVASVAGMAQGQRVIVALNSGTHTTVIEDVNTAELSIEVRDGLTGAAAIGKSVQAYDYSEPATDDVEKIIAHATGWSAVFQNGTWHGSTDGTAHQPYGESAWDLLVATAEMTGDFFRCGPQSGYIPYKRVYWYRTADASGMTLRYRNTAAQVAADTEDVDTGVIHSLEREYEHDLITRVFPVASDGRISLGYCTATALAAAAADGFAVVISNDLYVPDYVEYSPGISRHGALAGSFRFGSVSLAKKASLAELQAAADGMLFQAMTTLKERQQREYWRGVLHTHRPLQPGQTVTLAEGGIDSPKSGTYYVLEVRDYLERGVIMTSVLLSREPEMRPTAMLALGRQLKATEQAFRRQQLLVDGDGSTTTIVGGEGTPTDHGLLTGLTDDDHPQYLLASGTRALAGNMAVGAGVTIDGVDISAHAADPNAHHAAVTGYDTGIEVVSGQAIRVGTGAAGAGLGLSAGVLSVNTAAASGTTISADTVQVLPVAAGGLELTASGLQVKRPTDSGVVRDSTGVYLSPSTLTAATTNAVSGSGHTHAVTAVSDGKATPAALLKVDANGDLTLRYLTGDKVRTPLIDTASGGLTLDPANATVSVDGNMSFTGGSRTVGTTTSDLVLAPANELTLDPGGDVVEVQSAATVRSAHWASGFLGTGWGIEYDGAADFRSIYADELHVAAFIADTARVAVGAEYITPSMALISRTFTIPAVSGTGTLYVEDAPGLNALPVFENGDWVLLRVVDHSGGGLVVANAWGQVSGYADDGDGEQHWTFTCRSTTVAGEPVGRGGVALDFGKSGDGWWWVTTLDPAGAPYAGISSWTGSDPYTEGNRTHRLRLGQLKGVSGVNEWGLYAGATAARRLRFSDLAAEIHGTRLSLYAGDGAQARVTAAEVRLYRNATDFVTLTPNADHSTENATSTAGTYYTEIDEGVGSPTAADYVANGTNTSGFVFVGLTNPATWGAIYAVTLRLAYAGNGFSNDTVRVYAQVFQADEITPLTGELLAVSLAGNSSATVTTNFPTPDQAATQAQWNAARLRIRWEYTINAADEAIRLDPQVPSIAVGAGVPTGYNAGDGIWFGRDAGAYKARIGAASGVGLRWTGSALEIRNSANAAVIELDGSGNSRFAGAMTIGTSGGIWQGTGTFASPTTGLKIWNDGGVGRLATYSGGTAQVAIDTSGRLTAGAGAVRLDATGLNVVAGSAASGGGEFKWRSSGGALFGSLDGWYSVGGEGYVQLKSFNPSSGVQLGAVELNTLSNGVKLLGHNGVTTALVLSAYYNTGTAKNEVKVAGELWVDGGIRAGYTLGTVNRGQIVSNFASEHSYNAMILMDVGTVAHGMTSVVDTATYGAMGKANSTNGGLLVQGFGEAYTGVQLNGYATTVSGAATNLAPVTLNALLKSGTAGSSVTSGNILAVMNAGAGQMLVKWNGDIYSNSSASVTVFDEYDDPALLRALSRELNPADVVRNEWDRFVEYNRADLEAAGILEGEMVNQTALGRLLTGAVWQLHSRLAALEGR